MLRKVDEKLGSSFSFVFTQAYLNKVTDLKKKKNVYNGTDYQQIVANSIFPIWYTSVKRSTTKKGPKMPFLASTQILKLVRIVYQLMP